MNENIRRLALTSRPTCILCLLQYE